MANREETSSPEFHGVFVETSLNTHLVLLVHKDEIISDFKDKLRKEHKQVFPEIGEINVSALKVKRRRQFYYFSDSMNVRKAFDGISRSWFIYVDVVRVEKVEEVQTIMAADQNGSKVEFVEGKKEISIGMHTKDLTLEEGLEAEVAEKKTRKRKLTSSDGKKSRKKLSVDVNQSAVASRSCVVSPREKVDEILTGAMGKGIESSENKDISMEENQQTSDADRLLEKKILTVNSELVDEVKNVPDRETLNGALEKLDDLTGAIEQDIGKGGKTAELVKIEQEKDLQPASELVDGHITSRDDERGEGSRLVPSAADNLQTAELVTYAAKQLNSSSYLTTGTATEKRRKRTKISKDHINQSTVAATTTSKEIVNKINKVPGNVDCVDATSKSCPISERKTLEISLVEATQKENEMGDKSVEDVGRENIVTDNLASHLANPLEANSGLTTSPVTPVTEKKKKRKKSSKDHIDQSAAAATTTSREIANEMNEVPGNVDPIDATSESRPVSRRENLGKENEMGEKINEDVGSGKATPSSADNIQTDNLVSYPKNQLEASSGLTTGPATEKKKRKKSSKDHINQSTAATTLSREIVDEGEKVSGSIDQRLANSLVDAIQNEDEIGDKLVNNVGSREATLIGADKIQAANNLQVADLWSTPHTLAQESKTLDKIGKFTDENKSREHEVSKEKVDIDADQAKFVKSTKKKSSRKSKTPAKEGTLVDSDVQNVEPIKVVDGEGPDDVIRNVLDSLQQRNDAEENVDKSGKKSSKSSKKKHSLNIVEPQVLDSLQQKNETEVNLDESGKKSSRRSKKKHPSNVAEAQVLLVEVNNAAQEEAPPINNPKNTDALFTPAKKDIERDASHLKKSIQVADNTEDNNPSKQIQKENDDMADNFGSSQKKDDIVGGGNKKDQTTGGAKSKKEKNLGGSIDGSVKPKERKSRVQPASSGTSLLQSGAKNDRSESKVYQSNASVKGAANDKKEAVKKSSNSATVNKNKMNVNNKKEAVKKSSNSVTVNKSKMNFFKDADNWNSTDDESKTTSDVSTKSPSDCSADDDSDVTSMSRKQENNLSGGTNRFSRSLQDILRSSKSYKKAKLTASQSQPDEFDIESLALDYVPDSQAN